MAVLDMKVLSKLLEELIDSEYELMCTADSIDEAREHYFRMQNLVKQQINQTSKNETQRLTIH